MRPFIVLDSSQCLVFKSVKGPQRFFSLVFVVWLASVLSACGGGDKKSNSSGADQTPGLSSASVIASSIPAPISSAVSVASFPVASSAAASSLSIPVSGVVSSVSSLSSSAKSNISSSLSSGFSSSISSSLSSSVSSSLSSSLSSSIASSQTSAVAVVGSAYLKTRHTILFKDQSVGLARSAQQMLIDQCNLFRLDIDGLPAVSPSAEDLARLDIQIQEKFYQDGKALTITTGTGMILTDYQRWLNDSNSAKAPADCSQASFPEIKNGTLWRDGIKYDLRFKDKKAIGNKFVSKETFLLSQADYFALAGNSYLGQTCHEIPSNSTLVPDGRACMWDYIPYVGYLNWPFLLKGQVPFFPQMLNIIETVEPLVAEPDAALPLGTFDIPAGFEVVGVN